VSLAEVTTFNPGAIRDELCRMAEVADRQRLPAGIVAALPAWTDTISPADLFEGVCLALQSTAASRHSSGRFLARDRRNDRIIDAVCEVLAKYRARLQARAQSPAHSSEAGGPDISRFSRSILVWPSDTA